MVHGDLHGVVACRDGLVRKAVAFGAEEHGELLDLAKLRVAQSIGVIAQRQGRRLEAAALEQGDAVVAVSAGPCAEAAPGQLEDGAHAHPHGAAHERVAAGGGEQHRVDAQGRGAAYGRADVGGVGDALEHGHAAGVGQRVQDLGGALLDRALEGGEHAAGDVVPHELAYLVMGQHVDGKLACGDHLDVPGIGDNVGARKPGHGLDEVAPRGELALLEQKRQRLQAGRERHAHDLLALGHEHRGARLELAAQLPVGEARVDVDARVARAIQPYDSHVLP